MINRKNAMDLLLNSLRIELQNCGSILEVVIRNKEGARMGYCIVELFLSQAYFSTAIIEDLYIIAGKNQDVMDNLSEAVRVEFDKYLDTNNLYNEQYFTSTAPRYQVNNWRIENMLNGE